MKTKQYPHPLFSKVIILTILLTTFIISPALSATLRVGEGLDPTVPGNYNTISAANSASAEGDVIRVESGVYNENPTVYAGRILIGSGDSTKIMGNVYLGANSAIVGCYVENYIRLRYSDHAKIINCNANELYYYSTSEYFHAENCIFRSGVVRYSSYSIQYSTIIGCKIYGQISPIYNSNIIGNEIHIDESKYMHVYDNNIISNNLIVYHGTEEYNWQYFADYPSNTVEHNTIITDWDVPTPNTLWRNNIIYSTEEAAIDENGNLFGNPLFVDFTGGDYHLASGSPALNGGLGVDSDGSRADIGMYGGVRNTVWNPITEVSGKPVVGHLIVTPNPVVPGEPLRLRFTGRSQP